ncbi:MAG: hypothetical protein AAGH15_04790 [Myxococcota bacterium]
MTRLLPLLLAAATLLGCTERRFVGPETGVLTFAITADTAPFLQTEEATVFLVEERLLLPLRAPSDAQLAELATEAEDLPFPRRPWVTRGQYAIEVDYTLTNLDDAPRQVTFTLDGINEFHEYVPGFAVDGDEVIADFHQFERSVVLGPLERLGGTVREELVDEITVDLATVVDPGVTNPNRIVHPDNQSSSDPRALPFIPRIVPALVGLRAGLLASGAGNVVAELTFRVRDDAGRLVADDRAWELPEPTPFFPSGMMAAP